MGALYHFFHVGRCYFTSSSKSRNAREISDIFHFAAIHFLPERHSAMVLIYVYDPKTSLNGTIVVDLPFQSLAVDFSLMNL